MSEKDLENNLGETPMLPVAKNAFISVVKVLLSGSMSLIENDNTVSYLGSPE